METKIKNHVDSSGVIWCGQHGLIVYPQGGCLVCAYQAARTEGEALDAMQALIEAEPDVPRDPDLEICSECWGPIEKNEATAVDYEDGSLVHADCAGEAGYGDWRA